MEFKGKRVVITGAAGVIGAWISQTFAREGALLALSDIRKESLEELIKQENIGEAVQAIHFTDLRDSDSIASFVRYIEDVWGSPDIVINNAGVYPTRMFCKHDLFIGQKAAAWGGALRGFQSGVEHADQSIRVRVCPI